MTTRYRVLEGLPPYGPMPEQFSSTGQGTYREGFVVEFSPPDVPPWVGNFQRGMTSLDVVVASRGDTSVTVIAGGEAYVVEPSSRSCLRTFGGSPSSSKRSAIGYQKSQVLLRMNSVHRIRWIAQEVTAASSPARLTDCRV